MKRKRLLIAVLLLAVVAVGGLVSHPYSRQLVFGPRIQGQPLCVWQRFFRQREIPPIGFETSMFERVIAWFDREPLILDWSSLSEQERESLVMSLTEDPVVAVREAVVRELSIIDSQGAAFELFRFLEDASEDVRRTASERLPTHERAKDVLPKIETMLTDIRPEQRALAVKLFDEMADKNRTNFEILTRHLVDADARVRTTTFKAIVNWKRKRWARPAWSTIQEALRDPDSECRLRAAYAAWLFEKKTLEIIPVFREEMKSPDAAIRERATQLLRSTKGVAPELFEELVFLAKDENLDVRRAAILALGDCGGKAVPTLLRFLEEPDAAIQEVATLCLAGIGPDARAAVPLLLARLKKGTMAWPAGLGGFKAPEIVPELLTLLDEKEKDRQADVLKILFNMGPEGNAATDRILMLLKDGKPEIRAEAARTLGRIGIEPEKIVSRLLDLVKNPEEDESVRNSALSGLSYMGSNAGAAVPVLIPLLEDKRLQGSAIETLAAIGPDAQTAIPRLIGFLDPKNRWIDNAIGIDVLGKISRQPDKVVPKLIPLLEHKILWVRVQTAKALGRFGPDAKDALPALVALLDDEEEEVYAAAQEALARIDPGRYPRKKE